MDENDRFFTQNALDLKKDFFKSVFYLSTGTLALSITLTQANSNQVIADTSCLLWSWFFLGLTTILVLLFFMISESRIKYIERNVKFEESEDFGFYKTFIEGEFEDYLLDQKYGRWRKIWIINRHKVTNFFYDYLSLISSITFIIGYVFIIIYITKLLL